MKRCIFSKSKNLLNVVVFFSIGMQFFIASCSQSSRVEVREDNKDNFYSGGIIWMDRLKTCTPFIHKFPHPFFPSVIQKNTIFGREGNLCKYIQETPGKFTLECSVDENGIRILTDDSLYADMKNHIMRSSSNEYNEIIAKQCKMKIIEN